MGFVVDKAELVQFLQVLRFPLPNISPTAPHSSSSIIIQGWYNRTVVATVSFHPFEGGGGGERDREKTLQQTVVQN
jgi:hypothetical protein